MNTSPRRSDIESRRTIVSFMAMKAIENQLEKGQKVGDATKVSTSGEIEVIDEFTPRMETAVESHTVILDNNCRKLPNGKTISAKLDKKRRKMQLAAIEETRKDSVENDIEKE